MFSSVFLFTIFICSTFTSVMSEDIRSACINNGSTTDQMNYQLQKQDAMLFFLRNKVMSLSNELDTIKKRGTCKCLKAEKTKEQVAFMAEITTSYFQPTEGQHLVYNSVKFNNGNGYCSNNGTFITPVSGLYEFNIGVTAHLGADTRTHINIMNSGTPVGYLFFDNLVTGNPWIKLTESILVQLTVGDKVWVEITQAIGSVTIATGSLHTNFSGHLIQTNP